MATVLHRVPYSATNFCVYEVSKDTLQHMIPSDVGRRLTAGALAGFVACTAAYPLDLLRTRMAAETTTQRYRHLRTALPRIVAEEGVLGLYKGLGATLMQVVPGLAFNFCFYDSFKHAVAARMAAASAAAAGQGQGQAVLTPSALSNAVCACAAGLCTSTITFPLDVVRRRMQVYGQGTKSAGVGYVQAWRLLYGEGGVRAFYRGIVPEYCKVLPGMAIAFSTYEALKRASGARHART